MKRLLMICALIPALTWGVLFFVFNAGLMVHFIWIFVLVLIMIRNTLVKNERPSVVLKVS
jgi:ABC-type nickel/cobalt efflux system permease component RcnA